MMREEIGVRVEHRADGVDPGHGSAAGAEPSLGDLLKRLSTDTAELVQQEANLAKAELAQAGSVLAHDAMKVGVALALAWTGMLALTAFIIVGLGDLLNNYWLSALIVGVVFLAIGGFLAKNAIADVKRRGLKPEKTIATLREDATWAGQQAREMKRELTADTPAAKPKR